MLVGSSKWLKFKSNIIRLRIPTGWRQTSWKFTAWSRIWTQKYREQIQLVVKARLELGPPNCKFIALTAWPRCLLMGGHVSFGIFITFDFKIKCKKVSQSHLSYQLVFLLDFLGNSWCYNNFLFSLSQRSFFFFPFQGGKLCSFWSDSRGLSHWRQTVGVLTEGQTHVPWTAAFKSEL